MSLPAALGFVALAAILGNRIVSVLTGLLLKVPMVWLFVMVVGLDLLQIPFYYWVYENGSALTDWWPMLKSWTARLEKMRPRAAWAHSMGATGVFLVALLPSFGGGIWTAVLLAHALKIRKAVSAGVISLASVLSFFVLYGVLNPLISMVQYFAH